MKHLKLFFALFAMLALGVGNAWGAEVYFEDSFSDVGTSSNATVSSRTGWNSLTQCYGQYNSGLRIGSSKNPGTLTKTAMTNISGTKDLKVTIYTAIYNSDKNSFTITTTNGTITSVTGVGKLSNGTLTVSPAENAGVTNTTSKATWTDDYKTEFIISGASSTTTIKFATNKRAILGPIKIEDAVSEGGAETEDLGDALKWSATSATVQMGADDNEYPNLTNDKNATVTYSSSSKEVATIDANGLVTLVKEGTTTISAFYEGGEIEGVTYSAKTVSYTLTVNPAPLVIEPIEGGIIDILTHQTFAATSNQYANFSGKQAANENHSDAVYAGRSSRNGNSTQYSIQLNTIGTGRIATTTTGGLAKRVYVRWATQGTLNSNNRSLYIYGSNDAFTGSETSTSATKIGTITFTTGATEAYVDLTGDYKYILMTGSGAIYMDEIQITWIADQSALTAPTLTPAAGTYTAEQYVTILAEEGATIYYTTDGTEPTNESTEYSSAIVLDQCGETTIKAIAISADNQSPVAKATYTIQLPIPTNSAVDPYTEAEAIDVYNSGCYDGEELVYVTGTVQTAQFYNSGTYTITLTGGMQFYYFYEGADEDVFESDYINEGDDIVACGKLSMYNTIYQLAKGCYLVKHKPVAQLSWSKSTCTAEIGGTNEFPTLTNTNSVAVSYSSSNTAAATINETTGEIALVAAGETTITATFAGNENYKANSASYTLTVAEAVVRGTITYNTNGGTEVAAQENQTNLPETLPTTTKAGYNFGGWYTDAECNTPAVANSVLTGDITLHAKWLEPYTVAQALAMNVTTGVYVKGIISTITEVNTDYKNATYKISDDGTTTSEMIVYRGKNVDNTDFTSEDQIAVGDIVVIYGNLSEYNSAIQLAQGNYIYSLTEPTLYTVTISFETNGGEPVESIEANTLPDPFPTTTKEGHAFDGWYMDNALTIPAVAGTPITTDADITLYAKWTEVSKWATTYTSNIEVGSDEVIINGTEYEAKKTGTSSAYGSTSVVVPVSTHTLHFHAAGWGVDNLVNLVVKNGETVLGTFELSKDAGVKSNSPYTLAGTPYQQYYSVSLTNITAETTITFEASTSGGKRFVLYGVNQEGGIVPELNRIEIIGEATELTYEIGDVFNPAGLGVNAIYTLAGVDHETVAIDAEDVEWSFNPATIAAETSQVEVTATYMEKTATKTVADLTVNVPTPEITATPASIDWGTVNKDSEASKEVSVTLKAVANATISISGTNPSTFSVDKTALTETGTIVVSANTSSVGTFTATLTISDDAAAAEEKKISLKIIVEGIDDVYGNWQLVTDASTLKAGDMVIVASVEVEGKYYTMGKQNSNNRAAIESTVSETQLTPTTGTSVLTLVDAGDGKFAFQASNGKYLSAAGTGTSNYLREAENYDSDKTKWTISVTAEGIATIKATSDNRNWMRYNKSSIIFSCYGSGQTDIALYARVPDHSRSTSAGRYGTICLPGNIVKCLGATLYEVAGKDGNKVIFDEVLTPEAGMPYIFLAHNAEVLFYCGDQTAAAGNHNSLYGTFEVMQDAQLDGMYMVQNNKIVECNPANSGVAAYRAYFNGTELEGLGAAPAQMPGRKRITMGTEGENEATGTEDVVAPAGQTLKLIENGQLIIIRNGEKFNAQGVRL